MVKRCSSVSCQQKATPACHSTWHGLLNEIKVCHKLCHPSGLRCTPGLSCLLLGCHPSSRQFPVFLSSRSATQTNRKTEAIGKIKNPYTASVCAGLRPPPDCPGHDDWLIRKKVSWPGHTASRPRSSAFTWQAVGGTRRRPARDSAHSDFGAIRKVRENRT